MFVYPVTTWLAAPFRCANQGERPLHEAVRSGRTEVVQLLLEANASCEVNDYGPSA